jgi:hypothetical protein
MNEFGAARFPGAIGSCDRTHIAIEKCSYRICNDQLGAKQHLTTQTFNLTVNHRCRILSTTIGYPSWWNDMTVVLFDSFVKVIYEGNILPDLQYELLERDRNGNAIARKYRGPWLIVDNGYLKWIIPPFKITVDDIERRWSHWYKSLCKDVECTFGILKGCWRILKTWIRIQGLADLLLDAFPLLSTPPFFKNTSITLMFWACSLIFVQSHFPYH